MLIKKKSKIKKILLIGKNGFFAKNFIKDPGERIKNKSWTGYINLSIGDLIITYSKTNVGGEIFEYLEISNTEMFDYTIDEEVINVTG